MKLIAPVNKALSLEERGLLTVMLNEVSCDYCLLDNLYSHFPCESKKTIETTIHSLCTKGYVVEFKPSCYAVNKLKIHDMTIIEE